MDTFLSILNGIWQIIKAIFCWGLSVLIFCLSKLKNLFEKEEKPEYIIRQELFALLDEYFGKKFPEKSNPIHSNTAINNENDTEEELSLETDTPVSDVSTVHKNHQLPSLELLMDYPQETPENIVEEIESKKQIIRQTLSDFGISVTDISATIGATVTLYELFLARGVSANKIKTIDEDIARCLKVQAVRVISPFKDRGTVALEVPNNKSQIVGLKSILETVEFQNCNYELPLALGKSIDEKPQIVDLAAMPHILIGGATNNGKSVCLNAMLSSLLYTKSPEELKLVLIDPKVNEFSIYKKLGKQFNAPNIQKTVFTNDFDEIADALQSLCEEMKKRQSLFEKSNCRNIQEYNADKKVGNIAYLPRIIVVIDEFVDILGSKNKVIEDALLELVRKSRAQGIHLVVATQRPSAKQCSSEITSQFTARIAFKVIKWQNSDIILGDSGAEKLIGKGDMLFSNNSELERIQGAFVSTDEVRSIVEFIVKH
ncbi:MAG: hypothetical protein LBS55_07435 [Prevotellaceae bacterium]|nr:hypothetical protein [Prevotellaceae bacterium]